MFTPVLAIAIYELRYTNVLSETFTVTPKPQGVSHKSINNQGRLIEIPDSINLSGATACQIVSSW